MLAGIADSVVFVTITQFNPSASRLVRSLRIMAQQVH